MMTTLQRSGYPQLDLVDVARVVPGGGRLGGRAPMKNPGTGPMGAAIATTTSSSVMAASEIFSIFMFLDPRRPGLRSAVRIRSTPPTAGR